MPVRPVLIESLEDATACLNAAQSLGVTPVLITPYAGASLHGPRFWAALEHQCRQAFPELSFTLAVDCGDEAGMAMQAMALGLRTLIFATDHAGYGRLQTIALSEGVTLMTPAAEWLPLPLGSTQNEKIALCKDWLSNSDETTQQTHTHTENTHAH